jgi:hypothetical protein
MALKPRPAIESPDAPADDPILYYSSSGKFDYCRVFDDTLN